MFPVIELLDRLAIAQVKYEKTQNNLEELQWYTVQASQYDLNLVFEELVELKEIHKTIWGLESELKSGTEHQLPLEEIGRRAIEIRNWNNKRIALKNVIAQKLDCPVREVKKDHLSE